MQFKKRYEDIFKASPVGIVIYNSQYQMIEVNPYFIHLTGYSEEELLRLTFLDITHPADVPKNKNLAIRHFQGEVPGYRLEKRYIKKNGDIIWVAVTTAKFPTDQDLGIAIVENISDRITTEEALTQQTMKLVEVLNNSNSEKTISFGQKKKILIAEDDASARTVAVKYLQTEGYEITEAEDGNEAIALLNKNNFDLLILDLHMPFRDGYEILQCLPNDERPSILVCSAAKDKIQHFTKTFQFGADDYIEKPYDRIELILRVKALLRHKEKLIEAQRNSELDELTGLYN